MTWTRRTLWTVAILSAAATSYLLIDSVQFQRQLNRWSSEPSIVARFTPDELRESMHISWEQDCNDVCKQGLYARCIDAKTSTPVSNDAILGTSGAVTIAYPAYDDTHREVWAVGTDDATGDGWMFLTEFTPPSNGPASLTVSEIRGTIDNVRSTAVEFKVMPHLCGIEQLASTFGFGLTAVCGIITAAIAVPLWLTRKPKTATRGTASNL